MGKDFFGKTNTALSQGELLVVRMAEIYMMQGAWEYVTFVEKADEKWLKSNKIRVSKKLLEEARTVLSALPGDCSKRRSKAHTSCDAGSFLRGAEEDDKAAATKAGFHVKVAVGIILFVVGCFVTEAIPLPMVGLFVGIISLATGIMTRSELAASYWSDSTWFIMGSLMFAAAFVKTGVDKRLAMAMFGRLKNLDVKWVTLALLCVVSPLSMFMSDHALAAMFLPIIMMLYATSTQSAGRQDTELAKMLAITLCMACNLAGSLAPSGAARNIIMMNYAEQMFGVGIGSANGVFTNFPFCCSRCPYAGSSSIGVSSRPSRTCRPPWRT